MVYSAPAEQSFAIEAVMRSPHKGLSVIEQLGAMRVEVEEDAEMVIR